MVGWMDGEMDGGKKGGKTDWLDIYTGQKKKKEYWQDDVITLNFTSKPIPRNVNFVWVQHEFLSFVTESFLTKIMQVNKNVFL